MPRRRASRWPSQRPRAIALAMSTPYHRIAIGPTWRAIAIRWDGVLMASAMALGLWLGHPDARRRGLGPESLLTAAEPALLRRLVGARRHRVLVTPDYHRPLPRRVLA